MSRITPSVVGMAAALSLGLLMASSAVAGQIIYAHNPGPYSSSSNLYVMNDNGSNQRVLIPDNTYQGITEATEPYLQPGTTNLAFSASDAGPPGGGLNSVGVYTLLGGTLRRISPPVQGCTGPAPAGNCESELDLTPTLASNGQIVYEHDATDTGVMCFYYCGVYANAASAYYEQPANGTGSATRWPIPNEVATDGQYQPAGGLDSFYPPAFVDPGDPAKIAYAGLEDYNCQTPDQCEPVTVDTNTGVGAYNVTDAGGINPVSVLGWSPGGKYILVAFPSSSSAPGVWVFKNQPYSYSGGAGTSPGPIHGTGWWVWEPLAPSTIGQGGAMTSDTPGQGQVIFTYGGDIVSIPGSCWSGAPTTSISGTIRPTCDQGTELTRDGQDDWPTWTSSTGTIAVSGTPLMTVAGVSHGRTGASALINCSTGIGACAGDVGLATLETLHSSKVIAVSAGKTRHKTVIVGATALDIQAGTSETVKVALNGRGKRLLAKFHRLPTLLLVLQGKTTVAAVKVTFNSPRRRHH
jgi:hypothetical protein